MRRQSAVGWLALLGMTVLAGAGCHPGGIDDVSELDVVATFYVEGTDFGAFTAFAMVDTIYNLAVLADPSEDDTLDRSFDADIIAQVKAEMVDRGYTLVDTSGAHDLRLGLGAMDQEGTLLYASFPWWGYRPGYWYPSWNSVDFTKGSLLVFLVDWAGRDDQNLEVDPIWTGGLDGVIEGSASSRRQRLERGISQMFIQSPYLTANVTKAAIGEVSR